MKFNCWKKKRNHDRKLYVCVYLICESNLMQGSHDVQSGDSRGWQCKLQPLMVRLPTSFSFHASSSPPDVSNESLPPPQVMPKPLFPRPFGDSGYDFTDSNRSRCSYYVSRTRDHGRFSNELISRIDKRTNQTMDHRREESLIHENNCQISLLASTINVKLNTNTIDTLKGDTINRTENVRDS